MKKNQFNISQNSEYRRIVEVPWLIIVVFIVILCVSGCKKLIEVDLPIDKNTAGAIYGNTNTAVSTMSAIYARIGVRDNVFCGGNGLSIKAALMADELTPVNPAGFPEYTNSINGNTGWSMWNSTYREHIYRINSLIEGVSKSTGLADNFRKILLGEARFTRAFLYFYLVNFYGDVPLVLSTDFTENANMPRTPQSLVFEQIEKDLLYAQENLSNNYLDKDLVHSTTERVRPNKGVATALLSRLYLYLQKWQLAETEASKLISDSQFELVSSLNEVFLKNSKEAIWQLQPNLLDADGVNTPDGKYLINPRRRNPFYYVSTYILNDFENNDLRLTSWIAPHPSGNFIAFKYKQGWATMEQTEYSMVLRLAEQYLIRAEARANLNKLTGPNSAESDINAIRKRAALEGTKASTKEELIAAILHERKLELFTEWGHRWFDLKRTGKLNERMSQIAAVKGGSWAPYKMLLPIPYSEFLYNPALSGHQNEGYSEQP